MSKVPIPARDAPPPPPLGEADHGKCIIWGDGVACAPCCLLLVILGHKKGLLVYLGYKKRVWDYMAF